MWSRREAKRENHLDSIMKQFVQTVYVTLRKEAKCTIEVIYPMFFPLSDMESRDLLSDTIVHLHGGTAT